MEICLIMVLCKLIFDTETQLLESEQVNERYGISEKLEELGNYIYNLISECVNDSLQQHYYDENDTYISKMPTIEKQQVFSNIKKENNFTSYYYSYILPNVVNKPSWLSDNTFINISCNVYNDETIWKNDKSINKKGSISSYFVKDNIHLKKLMNNKKIDSNYINFV